MCVCVATVSILLFYLVNVNCSHFQTFKVLADNSDGCVNDSNNNDNNDNFCNLELNFFVRSAVLGRFCLHADQKQKIGPFGFWN